MLKYLPYVLLIAAVTAVLYAWGLYRSSPVSYTHLLRPLQSIGSFAFNTYIWMAFVLLVFFAVGHRLVKGVFEDVLGQRPGGVAQHVPFHIEQHGGGVGVDAVVEMCIRDRSKSWYMP